MLDTREWAQGSWERERTMFYCTAPGLPAVMGVPVEAVPPGAVGCTGGCNWAGGPWGCRTLPVLLGDPAASSAAKIWVSRISCQTPTEAKSLSWPSYRL